MDSTDRKPLRVLWVSLVEFPPLCEKLGKKIPSNCGWLYSSARALIRVLPELKLGVIVYSYGKIYQEYEFEGISYYLIPCKSMSKTNKKQIEGCEKAINKFIPDIIHIHGTEHSLAKAVCLANNRKFKVLTNIQGLASGIHQYVDGGLSFWQKLINITPLDFYRGTFLLTTKRKMKRRSQCENFVIKNITDIVGRTQWDCDHVKTINPNIHYHFMNETLRDSFYSHPTWIYSKCHKHTIFLSSCDGPLKGAHNFLKALPIVLEKYPDTVVNICGSNVLSNNLATIIRFQGYHLYLRRLIKKLKLEKHLNFLGSLSESQMKQSFLDANVYVLTSMIENSSNSLCEAQILGVPVIASYCGGTPSLVEDGKTGFLYRYEEIEMLAQTIIRIFDDPNIEVLSSNERKCALLRHNPNINSQRLADIYKSILC